MDGEDVSDCKSDLAGPSDANQSEDEDLSTNSPLTSAHNQETKCQNMKPGAVRLRQWLNKCLRVEMTDGRVLIGIFLCTDRDANVILGSCAEYLPGEKTDVVMSDEPRMLGLVMIPGKHIVNVSIDLNETNAISNTLSQNESEIM